MKIAFIVALSNGINDTFEKIRWIKYMSSQISHIEKAFVVKLSICIYIFYKRRFNQNNFIKLRTQFYHNYAHHPNLVVHYETFINLNTHVRVSMNEGMLFNWPCVIVTRYAIWIEDRTNINGSYY